MKNNKSRLLAFAYIFTAEVFSAFLALLGKYLNQQFGVSPGELFIPFFIGYLTCIILFFKGVNDLTK